MPKLCHSKCWRRLGHIFKLPKELTLLVQKDTDYVQCLKKHKNTEMINREPVSTIPASQVQNTSSKDCKTLRSRNQAQLPLASWSPASLMLGREQTLKECVLKKWTSEWVGEWVSMGKWTNKWNEPAVKEKPLWLLEQSSVSTRPKERSSPLWLAPSPL